MYQSLTRDEAERQHRDRSSELFLRRVLETEHYKQAESGERWITIGGGDEGRGTHVKIDGSGRIAAGPKALEGKNLDELGKDKPADPADDFQLQPPKNKPHNPKEVQKPLLDKHSEPVARPASVGGMNGPGVQSLPDGRKVGLTFLTASELTVDPGRFQYKIDGIDAHGVSAKLKDVTTVNPNFLGLTLAWHDPADGKTYVVNGHHRHELLTRLGYTGPIPTSLIEAKDASEARAIGALTNIAEGNGSALDAAKFLKEAGEHAQDMLRKNGVSLKGQLADDGLALANLEDGIFKLVINKQLDKEYATIMGRTLSDKKQQKEMLHDLRIMEQRGYDINKNRVQALADKFAVSGEVVEQQTDLFGTEEVQRSLRPERVIIEDIVKREIGKEVRTFTEVSRKGREGLLEQAGNQIDQDTNRRRAMESQELYQTFIRETTYKGPINDLANEYARKLAENPKQGKQLAAEFAERFRAEIRKVDQGTSGTALGGSAENRETSEGIGAGSASAERTESGGSENPGPTREPYSRIARAVGRLRYSRTNRTKRIAETILRYEHKFHYPKQGDTPGRFFDIDCFDGHCQTRKVYRAGEFNEADHPRDPDGKFAIAQGIRDAVASKKEKAKANLDNYPAPESLPENHGDYFNLDMADGVVAIDELTNTRARPEGIANAAKYMDMAAKGENDKRAPISVYQDPETGETKVLDGNSTFNVAKQSGWKNIPVKYLDKAAADAMIAKDASKAETQKQADVEAAQKFIPELESEGLGIKRHDMPQITAEVTDEFLDWLKNEKGAEWKRVKIPVGQLKGTQSELNPNKVAGMAGAMRAGTMSADENGPLASNDGYILDGHHRWGAQRLVDPSQPMTVRQVDMPIRDLLDASFQFDKVGFAGVQHQKPVETPKIDPSRATVKHASDGEKRLVHQFYKQVGIDESHVGSLASAMDDATVTTLPMAGVAMRTHGVLMNVEHKDYQASRRLMRDEQGDLYISNDGFYVRKGSQNQGIGTKALAKQIEQAAAMGVKGIRTYAMRDPNTIGYKIWPRMGYDADISEKLSGMPDVPPKVKNAKTVQDLMQTTEGREWWDENGWSTEMTFDPAAGSQSRKVFDKYLRRKHASGKLPEKFCRRGGRQRYAADPRDGQQRGDEPDLSEEELEDLEEFWRELEREGGGDAENYNRLKQYAAFDESDHPRDDDGKFTGGASSFNEKMALNIVANDWASLRRSDVFRLFDSNPSEFRQQINARLKSERPDLIEEADDVLSELGDTPAPEKPQGQKRAKAGGEIAPNGEFYNGGSFIATTDMPKRDQQKRDRAASGAVSVEPNKREVPQPGKLSIWDAVGVFVNARTMEINEQAVGFYDRDLKAVEDLIGKYKSGERYVDINDYPEHAKYDDMARMAKAGVPIPVPVLERWAKIQDIGIDQLQKKLGVKRAETPKPAPKDLFADDDEPSKQQGVLFGERQKALFHRIATAVRHKYQKKSAAIKLIAERIRYAKFKESEHPRDDSGKFTNGTGTSTKSTGPLPDDKVKAFVEAINSKPFGSATALAKRAAEVIGEKTTSDEKYQLAIAAGVEEDSADFLAVDNIPTVDFARDLVFFAREARRVERRKAQVDRMGDATTALFRSSDEDANLQYVLHKSVRTDKGDWQLTTFAVGGRLNDMPLSHDTFDTKEEAVAAAIGAHDNSYWNVGSGSHQIVWTDKDKGPAPFARSNWRDVLRYHRVAERIKYAAWREEDHPRDADGKFTATGDHVTFKVRGLGEYTWKGETVRDQFGIGSRKEYVVYDAEGKAFQIRNFDDGWAMYPKGNDRWEKRVAKGTSNPLFAAMRRNATKAEREQKGATKPREVLHRAVQVKVAEALDRAQTFGAAGDYLLNDEKAQDYSKTITGLIDKFGDKALESFHDGIMGDRHGVVFYSNVDDLNKKVGGRACLACYQFDSDRKDRHGCLHLDGGSDEQENNTQVEVYAHEISHAIDGPKNLYSGTAKWRNAWKSEILPDDGTTIARLGNNRYVGTQVNNVKPGDVITIRDTNDVVREKKIESIEPAGKKYVAGVFRIKFENDDNALIVRGNRSLAVHPLKEAPPAKLSDYATTETYEGFAEYGRLVFTNLEEAKKYPKCFAAWKEWGLIDG